MKPTSRNRSPQAILTAASLVVLLSSCSMLPFIGKDKPQQAAIAGELQSQNETEAGKYGFSRDDKSAEDEILIRRFEEDKSNLDHAITNTKDLIAKSHGRPFLPELYIRLSELYAEKSRVVFFLRRLEMGERGKMREISSVEAKGLKEKAIETYMQIISHFPEYDELDKVHFYLAHELREIGKYEEMSAEYETILEQFANSAFVPESLLLLGDYAFEQKEIDSALNYYHKVLEHPKSPAVVIARYKLAWVHINKRNYQAALRLFEQSVSNQDIPSTVDVDTYNRVDIRSEALADMAFTYSHVYKNTKPGQDSAYFMQYAWSRQSYIMVMEKLANRYMIKHKWDNAAFIYRELAHMQFDGSKLLEYTENLYTCVLESKNFQHTENDVGLIVKALAQSRYSTHVDDEAKQEQMTNYELYARDVATRLHEKAKRSNEPEDYALAASVYEQFLNFFDQSPEYDNIRANYAESLFAAGNFTRAGKIYEAIAATIEDPKQKHDPLYSSAVSYYTALETPESLNYYQIAWSQDGLRDVGQQYAQLYPNSSKAQDILFNIARIRYDKGEFEAAVQEFTAFVKQYPQGSNAKAAVELMMDALNLTENYDALAQLQQDLGSIAQLDTGIKSSIAQVSQAAQSKIIQEMVVTSINDWDSGKEKLLDFADNNKANGLDLQALNALFVSSEEHGDIETMYVAGQHIIRRFPGSEHAENATRALIDLSLTTGQYRVLADYLEQYVQQYPKAKDAPDFLFQAAQIRANLKQLSIARDNYTQLLSSYRLSRPLQKQATLALIDVHSENGDMEGAFRALSKYGKSLDPGAMNAMGAELAYYTRRTGMANKYLKNSQTLFSEKMVAQEYYEPLGRTAYAFAYRAYERYMSMQLAGSIDNSVVQAKTELRDQLQNDFIKAINYKSPRWSILSCYRLYEVNSEYANFLQSAPMPEGFSADEIVQYRDIIQQKVLEYKNEALQFLRTGQELAERIKPLDIQIAHYSTDGSRSHQRNAPFSRRQKQQQIGLETLTDSRLRELYDALYKNPGDSDLLLSLANQYYQRGDLGQALVISKNLLADERKLGRSRRSEVYSLMGSVYMKLGQDTLAHDTLEKALQVDKGNYSAAVNLAGLYYHYGYKDYANGIYSKRVGIKSEQDTRLIVARAESFFNAPE